MANAVDFSSGITEGCLKSSVFFNEFCQYFYFILLCIMEKTIAVEL